MLQLVMSDARLGRGIVEAVATLVSEANLVAKPEGARLRAMDPSRVAMVDLDLPASVFEDYKCDSEVFIGLNLEEMLKVMRRGAPGDKLEIMFDEKETAGRLRVRFRGKAVRTFNLPLLDIGREELPTVRIPFNVSAVILTEAFKDAIKDAEVVSDSIRFEANEAMVIFSARGDRGEVEAKLSREGGSLLSLEVKEGRSAAVYSLSYLADMMKAGATSDTVTLEFASNMPLSLTFDLAGGGRLRYLLAPRVEAE